MEEQRQLEIKRRIEEEAQKAEAERIARAKKKGTLLRRSVTKVAPSAKKSNQLVAKTSGLNLNHNETGRYTLESTMFDKLGFGMKSTLNEDSLKNSPTGSPDAKKSPVTQT